MSMNTLCQGKDSNGKVAPMGATTDPSGNPAGNIVLNSGAAQEVTQEHIAVSGETVMLNASGVQTITISGLTSYGFPYESVKFDRTAAVSGDITLTYCYSTSGVFIFQLTWSAGADNVSIDAVTPSGDDIDNIPYDVGAGFAVAGLTANSTGALWLG